MLFLNVHPAKMISAVNANNQIQNNVILVKMDCPKMYKTNVIT